MEKIDNFSRKMVTIIYGFESDVNYGVHYPTLKRHIEIYDLLPFANRGMVVTDDYNILRALGEACLKLDYKGLVYGDKYSVSIEVQKPKYEDFLHVMFKITEN